MASFILAKYPCLANYMKGKITMAATRTLAIQISEKLFQKLKTYLAEESQRRGRKNSQKVFRIISREFPPRSLWRKIPQ